MDKIKITKPHRKGCDALAMVTNGKWRHPWYIDTYTIMPRIVLRGQRFLILCCLDADCRAQLRVSVTWIEDMIAREAPHG